MYKGAVALWLEISEGIRESNSLMYSVPQDMDAPCRRKGSGSPTTGNKHSRYAIALSTLISLDYLAICFLIMHRTLSPFGWPNFQCIFWVAHNYSAYSIWDVWLLILLSRLWHYNRYFCFTQVTVHTLHPSA